jgi:uncharacterized protein YfaP (DUF2135 family)
MKNLQLMPSGHGHYKVTINYYGKNYSAIVSDMHSVDAYRSEKGEYRITPTQASIMLYNEVKRDNNLGKYNY